MSITIHDQGVAVFIGGPLEKDGEPGKVILRIHGGDKITPSTARVIARKLLSVAELADPKSKRGTKRLAEAARLSKVLR